MFTVYLDGQATSRHRSYERASFAAWLLLTSGHGGIVTIKPKGH